MHHFKLLFQINPTSGVPIYRQLIDQIRSLIQSGRWPAGTMLPSVREMASELSINMMTVSKAYAKLEADRVVERIRGTGMRVLEPSSTLTLAERKEQLRPLATVLVTTGLQLGLSEEQIYAVMEKALRDYQPRTKTERNAT
jgi:GntR family transcriptional regulator